MGVGNRIRGGEAVMTKFRTATTHGPVTVELIRLGEPFPLGYDSVQHILEDESLKLMFDDDQISECKIYRGSKQLTGVPILEWDRLKFQLEPHVKRTDPPTKDHDDAK